jgi:hypothetical protein
MSGETLTVESLARAIHEDLAAASLKVTGRRPKLHQRGRILISPLFDDLPHEIKEVRREQARLMLNRWMR